MVCSAVQFSVVVSLGVSVAGLCCGFAVQFVRSFRVVVVSLGVTVQVCVVVCSAVRSFVQCCRQSRRLGHRSVLWFAVQFVRSVRSVLSSSV